MNEEFSEKLLQVYKLTARRFILILRFPSCSQGVFVIGAGEGGVLLEHRESEWGDHVNTTDVVNVIGEAAPNKPAE